METSRVGFPQISRDQQEVEEVLKPEDSYHNGTYWADLPFQERVAWVNAQSGTETKREVSHVWQMFKEDPLAPFGRYWNLYVITGMGLFVEGYTIFSIGNLSALYSAAWPQCWSTYAECSVIWVDAVNYIQIIGIIFGQALVGLIGDWIGRRWGLVQDAIVMTVGSILLTGSWGVTLQGWVIMYAWSQFIYGLGVGGEYPMTSTSAMESKGAATTRDDKLHRGRNVVLAFLMQGWGQLVNQVVLIILLLIFNHTGSPPYTPAHVQPTFRLSFAVIILPTLYLAYYRFYKLRQADRSIKLSKKRQNVTGYDVKSLKLLTTHYWHRCVGTAGGWFCNDFFFYGNKIFAGTFINIISPSSKGNVMTTWLWNLVNIVVSLAGYYLAAFLIDHKFYGRKRMQAMGFFMDFLCFIIAAAMFQTLQKPGAGIHAFQFLYFFSSFWNQFGPNCTTFLLAAEIYPAPIRSTAHGVSAAIGKLGALAPTILYNYIGNQTKFWVVPWFGLAGFIITMVFIPDTTGLDLREQERRWIYTREGLEHEYHGLAIHPRHLSMYEKYVLGKHKLYNPELDAKQRYEELEQLYMATKKGDINDDDASELSAEVRQHFDKRHASGTISDDGDTAAQKVPTEKLAESGVGDA